MLSSGYDRQIHCINCPLILYWSGSSLQPSAALQRTGAATTTQRTALWELSAWLQTDGPSKFSQGCIPGDVLFHRGRNGSLCLWCEHRQHWGMLPACRQCLCRLD